MKISKTVVLLLQDGRFFYVEKFGSDEESIGRSCIQKGIVAITTLSGAEAAVRAIRLSNKTIHVHSIQEYHY